MSDFFQRKTRVLKKTIAGKLSKAEAARRLGVSRKTIYVWLARYQKELKQAKKANYRKKRKIFKKDVLRIIVVNPHFGPKRISRELAKRGKKISPKSVWLLLKNIGLGIREKREDFSYGFESFKQSSDPNFPIHLRLTPEARKRMVEEVVIGEESISRVCRKYHLSRKTFYKWLGRYLKARDEDRVLLESMEDNFATGFAHPRSISEKIHERILQIIRRYPEYSTHKIAGLISGVGNHGVQNLFKRLDLNTYEKRLIYAKQYAPEGILSPIFAFQDRLKSVWDKFVVGRAPAPPPQASKAVLRSKLLRAIRYIRQIRQIGVEIEGFSLPLLVFITSFILSSYFSIIGIYSHQAFMVGGLRQFIGTIFSFIALFFGTIFFLYSARYYLILILVLLFSRRKKEEKESIAFAKKVKLERQPFVSIHIPLYNEKRVAERIIKACLGLDYKNFEVIVCDDSTDETTAIVKRLASQWSSKPKAESSKPRIKVLHRKNRQGFKGGALANALKHVDKRTEFVVVLDADFVPYPDTIKRFLAHFELEKNKDYKDYKNYKGYRGYKYQYQQSNIAAVQGYQWHVLNKSENWITRGVRSEYAGSYVIERAAAELMGGLKQIAGSVYMIRADILKAYGWGKSITEDFELTLRLYRDGYKVAYTPYIQSPSECVSTLKRLIRQRMRWAEGHSYNIKKRFSELMFGHWQPISETNSKPGKFLISNYSNYSNQTLSTKHQKTKSGSLGNWDLFRSIRAIRSIRNLSTDQEGQKKVFIPSQLSLIEKLEFLYLSPYYLQAAFFIVGTLSWFIAEAIFRTTLPFWTVLWGWSLVFSNMFSLPLVNGAGMFLEESERRDYSGLLSFIVNCYILVPFQAYAAIKGFLEQKEGTWFRTPKTGRVTDIFIRGRFYRWISGVLPGWRGSAIAASIKEGLPASVYASYQATKLSSEKLNSPIAQSLNHYLALATANNRFSSFKIRRRHWRRISTVFLVLLITFSLMIVSLAPGIPYNNIPVALAAEVFNIDHETGDLTQYTSTDTNAGDLSVTEAAALIGTTYGMSVLIDSTDALEGRKDITAPSSEARFRWYLDPNTITMADGDVFGILRLETSGPFSPMVRVYLEYKQTGCAGYSIKFNVIEDGTTSHAERTCITDAEHYIEVHLVKAAAGTGTAKIYIDGTPETTFPSLDIVDNFAGMNKFEIGAPYGIDAGTSGTIYIDEFVFRDDGTEIGEVPENLWAFLLIIPFAPTLAAKLPLLLRRQKRSQQRRRLKR